MKVTVGAEFTAAKAGIEARSPELRLSRIGNTRVDAMNALQRSVRAWAIGLEEAETGLLKRTLEEVGVLWADTDGPIEIEIEVV